MQKQILQLIFYYCFFFLHLLMNIRHYSLIYFELWKYIPGSNNSIICVRTFSKEGCFKCHIGTLNLFPKIYSKLAFRNISRIFLDSRIHVIIGLAFIIPASEHPVSNLWPRLDFLNLEDNWNKKKIGTGSLIKYM